LEPATKSEQQILRSEANGFLPLTDHQTVVLDSRMEFEQLLASVAKMALKLHTWVSSLLQIRFSLSRYVMQLQNPG
jgi:hypothetical protein